MFKKINILLLLAFLVTSCETMGSVKRGLTGEKVKSTDEFFVRKKAPLSLPPKFDELPTPSARGTGKVESTNITDKLKEKIVNNESSTTPTSTEESMLKKIRQK
jgi:predicted small secreted protein|tara:strand:- start:1499 stop:1810 length:312 start_codon:yes stop_codon:yes gene_type:complete